MRGTLRYEGKFLISVGAGVLMFVAWQLWGTGLYTSGQQRALDAELSALPRFVARADALPGPPAAFHPGPGDAVFRIQIPAINLNDGKGYVVVQGVGKQQLATGPGHYPSCGPNFKPPLCTDYPEVWPGQDGRVVISGHRTTYLAPFLHIDQLKDGDEIIVTSQWGRFTYVVYEQRSVDDSDTSIVVPRPVSTNSFSPLATLLDPPADDSSRSRACKPEATTPPAKAGGVLCRDQLRALLFLGRGALLRGRGTARPTVDATLTSVTVG